MTEHEQARAMELYRMGYVDREIADQMGLKTYHIRYWRKIFGIASHLKATPEQRSGITCKHEDCFTCPYSDCICTRLMKTDKFYRHMVALGFIMGADEEGMCRMSNNDIPKRCLTCKYRRRLYDSRTSGLVCYYCLDTGHLRGCSAQECAEKKIHYVKRKTKEEA